VKCRIRLDKGGYIPGEKIRIWAAITNKSGVAIKRTEAILTEVVVFYKPSAFEPNSSIEIKFSF